MTDETHVILSICGGVVRHVFCNRPHVRITAVDWDPKGANNVVAWTQGQDALRAQIFEHMPASFDALAVSATGRAMQEVKVPIPPEKCECTLPGYYYSGIPGILAHMDNGLLQPGSGVERCGLCMEYSSDEAAYVRLCRYGLVAEPPAAEQIRVPGMRAHGYVTGVQRAAPATWWKERPYILPCTRKVARGTLCQDVPAEQRELIRHRFAMQHHIGAVLFGCLAVTGASAGNGLIVFYGPDCFYKTLDALWWASPAVLDQGRYPRRMDARYDATEKFPVYAYSKSITETTS